jgi:putative transposase
MKKFKSNNTIVFSCTYHVVWVTKYRKKYLGGDIEKRLKQICKDVDKECNFEINEMECERDHIHLLIDAYPQFDVHRPVKRMKGRSSRILLQEFAILRRRLPTLWTNSYFVCTGGGAPISVVKQLSKARRNEPYIESRRMGARLRQAPAAYIPIAEARGFTPLFGNTHRRSGKMHTRGTYGSLQPQLSLFLIFEQISS